MVAGKVQQHVGGVTDHKTVTARSTHCQREKQQHLSVSTKDELEVLALLRLLQAQTNQTNQTDSFVVPTHKPVILKPNPTLRFLVDKRAIMEKERWYVFENGQQRLWGVADIANYLCLSSCMNHPPGASEIIQWEPDPIKAKQKLDAALDRALNS